MSLLLIILVLFLVFGGGFYGYNRFSGDGGGIGIVGLILILLVFFLLFGGGYYGYHRFS